MYGFKLVIANQCWKKQEDYVLLCPDHEVSPKPTRKPIPYVKAKGFYSSFNLGSLCPTHWHNQRALSSVVVGFYHSID